MTQDGRRTEYQTLPKLIALIDPVMPISDRLLCLCICLDRLNLNQWDCQDITLLLNLHKHLLLTLIFRCHAHFTVAPSFKGEMRRFGMRI
jgi:hypothetical protein